MKKHWNKEISLKKERLVIIFFILFARFRFFKRINFFTSFKILSIIFCLFFRKNCFCWRNRFNFLMNLSMSLKFTIDSKNSHFFSTRIHFAQRRNKNEKRHFFQFRAQRVQNIIAIKFFETIQFYNSNRICDLMKNIDHNKWNSFLKTKKVEKKYVTCLCYKSKFRV